MISEEKQKALEAALGNIEKQFGKGSVMKLGDSSSHMQVEAVPTGCLSLDIALGVGGVPKGRIVEIYGPESSGKTTVALHMVAEVQKRGGIAGFIDAEHALDPVYAKNIGVDIDNLYISQPDNGEQALEITETMVRSGAVDIVIVDSVAALVPKAEIEGDMGDSHVGLQARLMSQALRKLDIRFSLGEHYLDGLAGQEMIMRTPGFEYYTPELVAAREAGAEVTSEMELFFRLCPCKIVAVTGSDGKTTTTTLIAKILEAAGYTVHLGGNLGRALLPVVDAIAATDVAVVELSSFQLISMRQSPEVAVVTNVTPNHLDHHKDMQEYIDAKRNILLYQKPDGKAVLGYENEVTRAMAADVKGSCRWFTRKSVVENGGFLRADGMLCMAENGRVTPIVRREDVALRGEHNLENLLAAFTAVWDMAEVSTMAAVAKSFAGVEHRIEPVRTLNGVQWFNDSIATSPTRTIAGLRAFPHKVVLIAGGYDKHIPFAPLAPEVVEHVKTLILCGATADAIEHAVVKSEAYETAAERPRILRCKDLREAVDAAYFCAESGDVVTLSPACAAFDCYANFMERGRAYKEMVKKLGE